MMTPGDERTLLGELINGGAIIDHRTPRERRFVAVEKWTTTLQFQNITG